MARGRKRLKPHESPEASEKLPEEDVQKADQGDDAAVLDQNESSHPDGDSRPIVPNGDPIDGKPYEIRDSGEEGEGATVNKGSVVSMSNGEDKGFESGKEEDDKLSKESDDANLKKRLRRVPKKIYSEEDMEFFSEPERRSRKKGRASKKEEKKVEDSTGEDEELPVKKDNEEGLKEEVTSLDKDDEGDKKASVKLNGRRGGQKRKVPKSQYKEDPDEMGENKEIVEGESDDVDGDKARKGGCPKRAKNGVKMEGEHTMEEEKLDVIDDEASLSRKRRESRRASPVEGTAATDTKKNKADKVRTFVVKCPSGLD